MFQLTDRHEAAFTAYRKEVFTEELALASYDYDPVDAPFATPEDRLAGAARVFAAADTYGYALRGSYFFWLNLAVEFGCDMHTDPAYRMIKSRMGDPLGARPGEGHELEQMTALSQKVKAYVAAVHGGTENVLYEQAGRHLIAALGDPGHLAGDAVTADDLFAALSAFYPMKLHYHGALHREKLAHEIHQQAAQQHLGTASARAQFAVAALDVLFGHGFASDPFKPWLAQALAETRAKSKGAAVDFAPLCDMLQLWFDRDE